MVIPINFDTTSTAMLRLTKITADEAKELLSKGFVSAIGHEGTAQLLTKLLGIPIPSNRIAVYMQKGDVGIHFFLKQRLSEGKVLTEEELKSLQYWLVKSEVL